ncbi:MAG: alpha-glucosidase C-terminal domain-containing protein [Kiritimatiellales bacterium]|nr:alpha-glucosidase C-terminal domain-containing protein [Kiritimatiellales bacterium]
MIKQTDIQILKRMRLRFNRLYGPNCVDICLERVVSLIGRYGVGLEGLNEAPLWDEGSSILITYGDMVQNEGERPLAALQRFMERHLKGSITSVHILPFFPYSSDDGFSVIDYRIVDPQLGEWENIRQIGRNFRLMYDLVLNHVSRKSVWFKNYIAGIAPHRDFFIQVEPDMDLSGVTRPRSLPLLTPVKTRHGVEHLWTTFSSDQIDLNFANPDVLFEFLDILMFYISTGARIVRMDAIAYLWKSIGTSCIHLNQTHEVVKLMRDLLDMAAPDVVLLTETNVPHEENISYFGEGDEAHMVYQFSLPPLLLHALINGNTRFLTAWAEALPELSDKCTYLNFTASHDGIGVRPLHGIVPDGELDQLAERMKALGGHVSTKTNSDGSESPYELNITYFDALGDEREKVTDNHIARFLCSQTVAMALQGVPAVYFHSLTATRNNYAGVEETGRARTINRKKWQEDELNDLLSQPDSATARVMNEYLRRIQIRAQHPAFHPNAPQQVIDFGEQLFAFMRQAKEEKIVCISNFADQYMELQLDEHMPELKDIQTCVDILSGQRYMGEGKVVALMPYQTVWLQV